MNTYYRLKEHQVSLTTERCIICNIDATTYAAQICSCIKLEKAPPRSFMPRVLPITVRRPQPKGDTCLHLYASWNSICPDCGDYV